MAIDCYNKEKFTCAKGYLSYLKEIMENKQEGEWELPYPVSIQYGKKDWNIVAAIREFISNAIDTKGKFNVVWFNGFAQIEDFGPGLTEDSFIIGESTRDESQIGQFGEGIKMALLVILRDNRKAWIETNGFTVIGAVSTLKKGGAKVMKVRFIPNNKKIGTNVFVECSEKELNEAKNLFLELSDLKKLDKNIYTPENRILICGLQTATMKNMLFSYNIEDKALTNRDRNIVDATKLEDNITKILSGTKKKTVIKKYLTDFIDNPDAYEYKLKLKNLDTESWTTACESLYKKAAISSDIKSDYNATAMGYRVLRNLPPNVAEILRTLHIKDSSFYAKDYKGEGLVIKDKIIFPISQDYVKDWTRKDAIRELISNSLDTASKVSITCRDDVARISDEGNGIAKKHFMFGVSEKSNTAIGKWGEGLKISCLVLTRTGSPLRIETVGTTYETKFEYAEEFGTSLLVIYFKKNSRKKGTCITFNCSKDELEQTKEKFVYFGEKKKIVKWDKMDAILNESGIVYVNGVNVAKIRSICSYDVRDNNIVISRDRNSVNNYVLTDYISRFLKYCNDESYIEKYLTGWQKEPRAIEYECSIQISDFTSWKNICNKKFKKCCISYSEVNIEYDLKAKYAGYTVLQNVPVGIKKILSSCDIPYSWQIANKYKNGGVLLPDKIVYPITSSFASNFTAIDAGIELLSNAIDTNTAVSYKYDNGQISISDKGKGISKKDFLFDISLKDENSIGQFGEGIKLAALAMAREKRNLTIISKENKYVASIEYDNEYKKYILVINIESTKKTTGTQITFKGNEDEYNKIKSYFLKYSDCHYEKLGDSMILPGGKIFVNGVYVQNIDSIFSYNIKNKTAVSRDRKTVNIEIIKKDVESILNNCDNKKAIKTFLTNTHYSLLEHTLKLKPSQKVKKIWEEETKKIFKKSCFATGTEYDIAAKNKGFNLIMNVSEALKNILSSCGITSSELTVKLIGDEKIVAIRFDESKLSKEGKKKWHNALSVFKEFYGAGPTKKIELISSFQNGVETDSLWGCYCPDTGTIYILYQLVEGKKHTDEEIIGTLIHEQVHRKTGTKDKTREFEFALSMELGKLAVMAHNRNNGKKYASNITKRDKFEQVAIESAI